MTSKIDDIDLEEALNSGAYHPEGTAACYSTYVGCPAYIVGDMKTMAPKDYFQDVSLAEFFVVFGRLHDFKPHIRKSALAAINFGVQHYEFPNIFQLFIPSCIKY